MSKIDDSSYITGEAPERALQQIFVQNDLDPTIRVALAHKGFRSCELMAAAGSSDETVLTRINMIIEEEEKITFGAPAVTKFVWPHDEHDTVLPAQKMMQEIRIVAIWNSSKNCRDTRDEARAKLEDNPEKIPMIPEGDWKVMRSSFMASHDEIRFDDWVEPHRLFLNRMRRDFILFGRVIFYEAVQMLVVADQVRSIQGIAKSVDDLLKATTDTLPAQVGTEEQLLDRITSFLYGLEFLGIMQVEKTTSLLYLEKLREFKRDYPGLSFILFYDKLFRTEVDREIKKNPLMTFRAAFINLLHRSQDIRSQTIVDVKAKGYEKTLVAIKDQTGEVANKTGGGPLQSGTPKLPGDTIDNDKISSKRAKNQRKAANKRRRFEEAGSVYPNPYVNGQTGGSASSQAWALLQQGPGIRQGRS
jgi:hypothetical protein